MKKFLVAFFAFLLLASCSGAPSEKTGVPGNSTSSITSENGGNDGGTNMTGGEDVTENTANVASPTYGSGSHKLEFFGDFQCPACINAHKTLDPIFTSYADAGKLLIEYRQFPLTTIHKNAYRDAFAALCAEDQGKYQEYKEELYTMEENKAGQSVTDGERIALASNIGADTEAFSLCLSSNKYKAKVDADMAEGESRGVNGTPTYFLDGKKLDMSSIGSVENLKKLLDVVTGTENSSESL